MAKQELTYGSMDSTMIRGSYDPNAITPDDGSPPYYNAYSGEPDHDEDDRYNSYSSWIRPSDPMDYAKHFRLRSYVPPPPTRLGRRATTIADGDVHISLSPEEEDTIVMSSDMLRAHPFWRASLGKQWVAGKTLKDSHIKRYKLEFLAPGESILVGKTRVTSPAERQAKFEATQAMESWDWKVFDERSLWCTRPNFRSYIRATIAAHKIGFALLCSHPPEARRSSRDLKEGVSWTLIILELLEWVHNYVSMSSIVGRLTDFILHRGDPGMHPLAYLSIACHIKSPELYKIAMKEPISRYESFIDELEADYPLEFHQCVQVRLIRELSGDEPLAFQVVKLHSKYMQLVDWVASSLDDLSFAWELKHREQSRAEARLYEVAKVIFQHWWTRKRQRLLYNIQTYETLVHGNLDMRSLVGHWKARNKQWKAQLPRKTSFDKIVLAVEEVFQLARVAALEVFDEKLTYCGPGYWGRGGDVPEGFMDYYCVYPWEAGEFQHGAYWEGVGRSKLSIVFQEPALGDTTGELTSSFIEEKRAARDAGR